MTMTRRGALKLVAVSPFAIAGAAQAQSPVARGRRLIAAGRDTFLLEGDGTVKAWSLGDPYGWRFALGHSNRVRPNTAYDVPLTNVVSLAAGENTAYALLANGTVMAWGGNARGELGATPRSEVEVTAYGRATAPSPLPVLDVTDAIEIAAGDYHALAVTRSGQLWVWGYNLYQQLGIDMPIINFKTHTPAAMQYLPFPMRVPGLSDVVSAAGGAAHSLVLLRDGTVRAWGTNKSGQLGDGTTTDRRTPVPVIGVKNAVAVEAFADLSAAVLADGTVMTWGFGTNALGRQPAVTVDAPYPTPALVPGVTNIASISLGSEHALVLTRTGTVMSWGDQRVGERGHPGIRPAPISGLTKATSIEAYTGRTFAVLANGTIMTLGQVPYWARLGGDKGVAPFPIPLVIRNLKNPI